MLKLAEIDDNCDILEAVYQDEHLSCLTWDMQQWLHYNYFWEIWMPPELFGRWNTPHKLTASYLKKLMQMVFLGLKRQSASQTQCLGMQRVLGQVDSALFAWFC
jgi:hypothetical protein